MAEKHRGRHVGRVGPREGDPQQAGEPEEPVLGRGRGGSRPSVQSRRPGRMQHALSGACRPAHRRGRPALGRHPQVPPEAASGGGLQGGFQCERVGATRGYLPPRRVRLVAARRRAEGAEGQLARVSRARQVGAPRDRRRQRRRLRGHAMNNRTMLLSLFLIALPAAAAQPIACADLKAAVSIPDTTITLAELRPAGANPNPVGTLPVPICRVVGVTKPAVQFEVWMPTGTSWNGKFQLVGNGGTAGVISYSAMRAALARGYATASTDTGHVSSGSFDSTWALGRPDLVADFGHRGTHVTALNGKQISRGARSRRR